MGSEAEADRAHCLNGAMFGSTAVTSLHKCLSADMKIVQHLTGVAFNLLSVRFAPMTQHGRM